jgi:WD40 repeat protein
LLPWACAEDDAGVNFADHIQPILTKYCSGCHNNDDREGDFSLETFADLTQGLEDGPVILAGQPNSSKLFRVVTGLAEPAMPPEDHQGPDPAEIALLKTWITAGARGPAGSELDRPRLIVPTIARQTEDDVVAITALACSPATDQIAVARFRNVEIRDADGASTLQEWSDFPGKVNALSYSESGELLVTASGVTGLFGQADVFEVETGERRLSLVGHRDTLYDAQLSPNGEVLATASYDGQIILWDTASGAALRTIDGHNGAVFDVEFDPSGTVLATASADETIKLWKVETGVRLDTLSQPTAEQYAVSFSPDGKTIVAGGADNRIRVWEFVSRSERRINPLRFTRFAHENAVLNIQFALAGQVLVTTGADRRVRLWETSRFADSILVSEQPSAIHDSDVSEQGHAIFLGGGEGKLARHELSLVTSTTRDVRRSPSQYESQSELSAEKSLQLFDEQEPNDRITQPQSITLPAQLRGAIHPLREGSAEDVDYYKFHARAGDQWVIEIKAARETSPLDSKVEVLTAEGNRIERLVLQAVRDSYFTFRGKDSTTCNDYRVRNWEEMQLNEYFYAGGEVTKLWHYPRGPDSGFVVYPGKGDRFTYFGSSAVAHALGEPAYIVEPHLPGTKLIPTGLPIFPVYFENDDDGRRKFGADSYLQFTAPHDGDYLIKVRDVRGLGGDAYTYELSVRQSKPDFVATITLEDGNVSPGSGKEFSVKLVREDGFEGEVRVDIDGLPTGYHATTPIVVEAGQMAAFGVILAETDAPQPAPENATKVRAVASAEIGGEEVAKKLEWKMDLKLGDQPEVVVQIIPVAAQKSAESELTLRSSPENRPELTIAPGETISALVRIERKAGFDQRVSFGALEAGRNLPHGIYVDNIGLNGLMIVKNAVEREFFITADAWVPNTTRLFHLRTEEQGKQTSWPVILHVRK